MKIHFLIIIILLFPSSGILAQDEFTLAKEGQKAPEFSYENNERAVVNLSDLKGKVVWITFFATWCGPCRKELPYLESQVYEKFRNHPDFELLVIGREHSREELEKFSLESGHKLPFIPDQKREIFSKYAAQNIPRNLIIDREGKISTSSVGFNEEDFDRKVKKLEILLNQTSH